MKKRFSILVVSAVIAGVVLGLVGMSLVSQAAPESMVRKIVVFQTWFVNDAAQDELIKRFGVPKIKHLDLINGMAVYLPSKAAERALEGRPEVLRIDNDDVVFALGKPYCNYDTVCQPELGENPSCPDCKNGNEEEPTPQPDEIMAWGVDRIDADKVWAINPDVRENPVCKEGANTGQGVRVAIIDTGIDLDHEDLMANIAGGYNAIHSRKSYDDDNGHGTHVAGIVAAVDNDIGVVGVAPEAWLYAVKVLDRRGIGFLSDVIEGLQWSVDKEMQVVNMSIGSSGDNQSYHDAIIAAHNAGITIVAAAGNDGETDGYIYYPACYLETIAVSATNIGDGLAYFSSFGEEIDLAAPGKDINSTWKDGGYHVSSGTSMATPHVVGTAALVLADPNLKCDLDGDSKCSPVEVQKRLESTSERLPGLNSDQQGSGLVDAEKAVQ